MSFNAADGDTKDTYALIPKDVYTLALIKAEKKKGTKEGAQYVDCQVKIIDGDYAKRMVFLKLNLKNNNAYTVEISERLLRQLMLACNVPTLKDKWDLSKLLNIPVKGRITIKKGNEAYPDDTNSIQAFIIPEEDTESGGDPFNDDDGHIIDKKYAKLKKKLEKAKKSKDKKQIKKAQKAIDAHVAQTDVPF